MPNTSVTIYFDGECPICHRFVRFLTVQNNYDLELVDMRSDPHLVPHFDDLGVDLDQGFVVVHDDIILQGEQAFVYLDTVLGNSNRFFRWLFHQVVRRPFLRKWCYHCALRLRNLLLLVEGRKPLHINTTTMKGKMFGCPCIVNIVFGGTIALMGLEKLLSLMDGTGKVTWVGNAALSLIGLGGHLTWLAITLGILVGVIEFLGGISFMVKCNITSKYSAIALSTVMFIAVLVHLFIGVGGPGSSAINAFASAQGYGKIMAFMLGIQVPLLYAAVFTKYAYKKCCGSSCMKKMDACCGGACATKPMDETPAA